MSHPKKLGKGLEALLGSTESLGPVLNKKTPTLGTVSMIPIQDISPGQFQPRGRFKPEALEELAASIREKGILQPILIRATPQGPRKFEIIAGERRWRAAKMAERTTIPALIKNFTDQETLEVALIENIQRDDLSPIEEAQGYQTLMNQFRYTQEALSKVIGKSRSAVANTLRLLSLPERVQAYLKEGMLSGGHGKALLAAEDPEALADEIIRENLTVRDAEKRARGNRSSENRLNRPRKVTSAIDEEGDKDPALLDIELQLEKGLKTNVEINLRGEKGEISIKFSSLEELDRLMQLMTIID